MTISLEGLDKAAVVPALYNASKPLGMGFLYYDPLPMTIEEARELLKESVDFDYLKGRVMKVYLGGDELDPWGYDRDNGQGAASRAISALVAGDENQLRETHRTGVASAAKDARRIIGQQTTIEKKDGIAYVNLGLSDVADVLGPATDKTQDR